MMLHSSQENSPRLAPIDFHSLKSEVGLVDVLALMKWQAVKAQGSELRGPCPVHGSSSPTSTIFAVNTEKNAWKCHKCEAGGNQLDLAAHFFGLPREQSVRVAVTLCRQLGREIPRLN